MPDFDQRTRDFATPPETRPPGCCPVVRLLRHRGWLALAAATLAGVLATAGVGIRTWLGAGTLTFLLGAEALRFLRRELHRQRAADRNLEASGERFHRLVDAITDYAIVMLDGSGCIATCNAGAERINGYDADEIVGKDFSVFYTREDRDAGKPEKVLSTVRRDGRFEEEGWRVRKDGSRFWANDVMTALRDAEGRVRGFAKITRDFTARRDAENRERRLALERLARAESERSRLQTLLNQVPAIVNYLRGPRLVLEFVHPGAAKILGSSATLGKPLSEAKPDAGEPLYYERVRRVYETGQPFLQHQARAEWGADRPDGNAYWDSIYLPVRDAGGSVEGVMTFDIDVTETVRTRHEMERVNRAKDVFLATVSHELRTPLNAISGWASMLRRKPREEDKVDRGLEVIERNARAQGRILSDLLDVSRVVCGKLELKLKSVQVFPAVLSAADVVKPTADSKGVGLAVDLDPRIGDTTADPDRLQQIVSNLLANAVRFTPRGGRVTVSGKRTASGIVLQVRDTGIGIPRDKLSHIFERFVQVDSSNAHPHGGLGLGLAIVRHLVEAHGGNVGAESEGVGRGATFTVTLPIHGLAPSGTCAAAAVEAPAPPEPTPLPAI